MRRRVSALAGSSARYSGPSSTEKPSCQKCRLRCTAGGFFCIDLLGSSMIWLGVSSPPSVWAGPVKCEIGATGSSPPGLAIFLECFQYYTSVGVARVLTFLPSPEFSFFHPGSVRPKQIFPLQQRNLDPHHHHHRPHRPAQGLHVKKHRLQIDLLTLQISSLVGLSIWRRAQEVFSM